MQQGGWGEGARKTYRPRRAAASFQDIPLEMGATAGINPPSALAQRILRFQSRGQWPRPATEAGSQRVGFCHPRSLSSAQSCIRLPGNTRLRSGTGYGCGWCRTAPAMFPRKGREPLYGGCDLGTHPTLPPRSFCRTAPISPRSTLSKACGLVCGPVLAVSSFVLAQERRKGKSVLNFFSGVHFERALPKIF